MKLQFTKIHKSLSFFFRPTVLHDHAASRLVKREVKLRLSLRNMLSPWVNVRTWYLFCTFYLLPPKEKSLFNFTQRDKKLQGGKRGPVASLQQKLFSQGRDTFSGVTTTSPQGQFRNKSTDTKSAGIKEKWLPTYFTWISFIFSKSLRETNLVQKCTKMCCNKMCGTIFCVALKFDKGLKGL